MAARIEQWFVPSVSETGEETDCVVVEEVTSEDNSMDMYDESPTTPSSTTSSNTTTTVTATTCTASKFRQRWKSNYPWLTYDTTRRLMFCSICQRHKKNNQYASGTKNFKHTNILRHMKSLDHRKALEAEAYQSLCTQAYSEKRKAVMAAIRNVYWLAKEEIATLKYGSLNLLQGCPDISHLSVAKNAQYTSPHIAEEMQDALSDCLKEDLKGLCQEADFVGILIDESTDISVTHNLIVYIRIIRDEAVSTHFLELVELDEGATGNAVADKVLEENGIGITEHWFC